MENLSDYL